MTSKRKLSIVPSGSTLSLARLFSDQPVPGGQTPHFEFDGLGRTLAALALNPDNATPFTVVVRGGWGRGKTTLLRHTQHLLLHPPQDLVGDGPRRQVRTLWFNAWKYPDADTVLAGLLGELLLEMQRGSTLDRLKVFLDNNKGRGFRTLLQLVLPTALTGATAATGIPLASEVDPGAGRFDPVREARAFHDVFRDLFGHLSHLLFDGWDVTRCRHRLEDLWDGESSKKYTLAIFLDDLDRCRQERVIETLEAINLFLDLPGVCFYLGLDWPRLVALLPEDFRRSADPFLDKIVQVSLDLPQVTDTDAERFVRDLISGTPLAAVLTKSGGRDDVKVIAAALEGENRHPRHIKRFLNDLSMGLSVLRNTDRLGDGGDLVPESAVVAWHLLAEVEDYERWRDLRASIANVKAYLQVWEAVPRSDETAAAENLGPRADRLRRDRLLEHHIRLLKELNDAQLMSLVLLASPPPIEQKARITPTLGTREMDLLDRDSPIWVEVSAGSFEMGSFDGGSDEQPVRNVTISHPYRMAKFPTTNEQYAQYVRDVQAKPPSHWRDGQIPDGKRHHPVANVSWQDATAFCIWLHRQLGLSTSEEVRLPTEAEWEYAARGTEGRGYPWGDESPTPEHANYGGNIGDTSPVGTFAKGATPLGIHDLAGNVWEWCHDWHGTYPDRPETDPTGPSSGRSRVFRGGSFNSHPSSLRGAQRLASPPRDRDDYIGFRVVWRASTGQ